MDAEEEVFLRAAGLVARTIFFFGDGFFPLDFDPASAVLGSAAALAPTARADGSGPWPLARFSGSILDFLITSGCLRLRAKSTDEARLASGFCKPFACG